MSVPAKSDSPDDGEELVTAMTRPMMVFGVLTFTSIGFSIFPPTMLAMVTGWAWFMASIPVLLFASYLICLKDVYLFEIGLAMSRIRQCPNKRLYGCRRYAAR